MPRWIPALLLLAACTGDQKSQDTAQPVDDTDLPSDSDSDSATLDCDGDGYLDTEDCEPCDAQVNPGAEEICDSVDNNCDEQVDEGVTETWYRDEDGDGFGDTQNTEQACGGGDGLVAVDGDCDDDDPYIFAGAEEICDLVDNDCDGEADEGTEFATVYADTDGDGYGDPEIAYSGCEIPTSYVPDSTDCDDSNDAANPGHLEICDGVDNNCDGAVDEDTASDATEWFVDGDGDGYGDPALSTVSCEAPSDSVADSSDCDDGDAAISPEGIELCDGVDNNCDGEADEATALDASTWYHDGDADSYGDPDRATVACDTPEDAVSDNTDCDDEDASVSPAGTEACNGIDDDCDEQIDEDDAVDASTWYTDADGDRYGDPDSATLACEAPAHGVSDNTDCDDTDAAISPEGTEICDGLDNNCDGAIDEDAAADVATWYTDADGDNYGDPDAVMIACEAPADGVSDSSDCDDEDPDVSPAATEVCDGIDNNCDGEIDEDTADGVSKWYDDADGDSYGDPGDLTVACEAPVHGVSNSRDCDDTNAAVSPAATEICDGVDNNCDGEIDEDSAADAETWYTDADDDGYGDVGDTTLACDEPAGTVSDSTDCDDDNDEVYPGAAELCDGLDNNCDGVADDGVLGTSSACPAENCLEIIESEPDATDGTYYLDPTGSGSVITVSCEMDIDGGGWTQMSSSYLSTLSSGITREYLYTYGSGFYISPETSSVWSWSSYVALPGTYTYGTSDVITGTFGCSHGEAGYWGIGCSNSPGGAYKVLPWGSSHDTTTGRAQVCQDRPDVFGVGACAYPSQIWVRP